MNKTGAAAKIPGVAEKALANFPENEDLLLYNDRDGHDAEAERPCPGICEPPHCRAQ